MTRVRQVCACRRAIEAAPTPESVEHAVQVHQRQIEHREFTVLEQLRVYYVAPQDVALLANVRRAG